MATDTMEPIAAEVERFRQKLATEPTTAQRSPSEHGSCPLCASEREPWQGKFCASCSAGIKLASEFDSRHCVIPPRYKAAASKLEPGSSYLLFGFPGTGKTFSAYGLLIQSKKANPRLRMAAYYWPTVLMELRRGYARKDGASDELIDALRTADLALLDDLAAEKISSANQDWLRETLGCIVNDRWANLRPLIVTTNAGPDQLAQYLGQRIVSRLLGMCILIEMKGADQRLTGA